jgi:hypothetical protein
MAVGTLLKINNVKPPKLKGYTVKREKLLSEAERTMSGELKATVIGVFPNLQLEFAHTTQDDMSTIIDLLDPFSLTVQWWDEKTDAVKTGTFYAGSWEIPLMSQDRGIYEGFTVNLIPFKKL